MATRPEEGFEGLRVVSFESRRAEEYHQRYFEKRGGGQCHITLSSGTAKP